MLTTAHDVYRETVQKLEPAERLRLASMIMADLKDVDFTVVQNYDYGKGRNGKNVRDVPSEVLVPVHLADLSAEDVADIKRSLVEIEAGEEIDGETVFANARGRIGLTK